MPKRYSFSRHHCIIRHPRSNKTPIPSELSQRCFKPSLRIHYTTTWLRTFAGLGGGVGVKLSTPHHGSKSRLRELSRRGGGREVRFRYFKSLYMPLARGLRFVKCRRAPPYRARARTRRIARLIALGKSYEGLYIFGCVQARLFLGGFVFSHRSRGWAGCGIHGAPIYNGRER